MIRTNTIPAITVKEAIASVVHQIFDKQINIAVAKIKDMPVLDPTTGVTSTIEQIDTDKGVEDIKVSVHNYRAIMSGTPSWASNKPQGLFGEDELWLLIEAERAGTNLAIGTE